MSDLKDHPLASAKPLGNRWTAHLTGSVIAAAWSAGEQTLAAASICGELAFFTPDSDKPNIQHGSAHAPGMCSLSWHPRQPLLASGGQDGQVKIWLEGRLYSQVETRDAWIEKVAWSPDGQWLAAAAGREIYLWGLRSLDREFELHFVSSEHADILTDIAWRPWHRAIPNPPELAAASCGQISFWQPDVHDPTRILTWQANPSVLAWSPSSRFLACAERGVALHLWALPAERRMTLSGAIENLCELAWDSTGSMLASGGNDVSVWYLGDQGPEGTEPSHLDAHQDSVTALAFQRDGPLLASGGREGLLAVWNPFAGPDALYFDYHEKNEINCLCWSGRDSYLVAGTADGRIALYDNPIAGG